MLTFSLFRKPKHQENPEQTTQPPQETKEETNPSTPEATQQAPEISGKTYLKAMPLRELIDVENVKDEVKKGNIIILKVTPLASKSIDDVKNAVNELSQFTESIGGDIARLGEERVVICPPNIRIWREKTQVSNEPLPTAA